MKGVERLSDTKWTDEQKRAIDTRGKNLLVAAAAGAGKTAVLVERIIKKITDFKNPIDIDSLLVVTFTNAAASEMRERIGEAISGEIDKNPDSKNLQRQLALLNKSSITTIHSFCLDVIRNNFHLIDIDPNFRIADETEATLLKQEVMEELFEKQYEKEERQDFLRLVECYGGSRDDIALQDMVLRLYEFSKSTPWPKKWLIEMADMFNIDEAFEFKNSIYADLIIHSIKIELSGILDMTRMAQIIVKNEPTIEGYLAAVNSDVSLIDELICCCNKGWESLREGFLNLSFEKLGRCGKDGDKDKQDIVKDIRKKVKERINSIKDEAFILDDNSIKNEFKAIYPLMKSLSLLVIEFDDNFKDKKREKGIIDFNDIEHFCLEILIDKDGSPTSAALELRERFEEILIDEYQDSNLVQEVILSTISKRESENPNQFMVGDVKQSIYRFRQAKPELFLEKYSAYPEGDGYKNMKVLLYKNFRSREEIINASNYIFKAIMSIDIGELEYDEKEALNKGASYPENTDENIIIGGPVEVHLIEKGEIEKLIDEEEKEEEEELDSVQLEARLVAKRIKQLINNQDGKRFNVYDKNLKTYRPLEYRDIVILMRATANASPVFMEELMVEGIPVYADTGTGYFNTIEVKTMMSLLQIIDNPMQDIPLLSVLRSPIGGFNEEEIIDIRLSYREGYIFEALKKRALVDDETGVKISEFLNNIDRWRKKSIYMSTDEFIWFLYTETGYYAYSGAMPGGVQRQANLRLLFERAKQYENTSYRGLFNFINFINRIKKSSGDMGSAKILGENENVVRIMSIHKSKGLEFPVVILSCCGKSFNLRDMTNAILLHHTYGFGPDYVDYKRRIAYSSIAKQALKRKIKLENLSEEMRILYVAFTRAKEKLIITGSINNLIKKASSWAAPLFIDNKSEKVPEFNIYTGKNYLDWICPALMKHYDCESLRGLAKVMDNEQLIKDNSKWSIKIWNRDDILKEDISEEKEDAFEDYNNKEIESEYKDEIINRLEWEYSYLQSSRLPAKLTVTELKGRFNNGLKDELGLSIFTPPIVKKPGFMDKKKDIAPAERGTITHLVMQHLILDKVATREEIEEQIKAMISKEIITENQAKAVDIKRLEGFFISKLGERMLKSHNVKREVPFFIKLKSTEVYNELPEKTYGEEFILLQGVIDCIFEEDDGLVLIDYKTDYVNDKNRDSIKEKYRVQIAYYEKALEKMIEKRVKDKYIYLFYNGEIIEY